MRRIIYLSDDLNRQVEAYLQSHSDLSISDLIQQTLTELLRPADTAAILELAGVVDHAPGQARERAEDEYVVEERQSS